MGVGGGGTRPPRFGCGACVAAGARRRCCPGAESCPGVWDGSARVCVSTRASAAPAPSLAFAPRGRGACSPSAAVCREAGGLWKWSTFGAPASNRSAKRWNAPSGCWTTRRSPATFRCGLHRAREVGSVPDAGLGASVGGREPSEARNLLESQISLLPPSVAGSLTRGWGHCPR